ncbi:MAG TPA: 6-carboxytetrahydropterin synthase [Chloroflexota bacterium]|jgi:6-pyruvoyltetrahydropterin/6-carboxytetrahydropterin synthase|nr:6-carboxytetrahydropterin synthase [Chloroflexota bacterium]
MFEIGVIGQFEAAHSLRGDFGPAAQLHGHTYRVELVVRGDRLGPDDTLIDLGVLRPSFDHALAELNYKYLNQIPSLQGRNSTAEVVAEEICRLVIPTLDAHAISSVRVQVWESPFVYGAYEVTLERGAV